MPSETLTPVTTARSPAITGLSEAEAQERLSGGRSNAYQPRTSRSLAQILRENTFTLPNMVLVAIGVLLWVIGEPSDAIATGGLVLFNMLVGFIQEVRAKQQIDHLAVLGRPNATVIRDGQERTIDPAQIVVDDLLVVRPGDQILVDGAIAGPSRIAVDESLLTGESDLVTKAEGDQVSSGSYCMEGTATYVAQKVGAESYANQMTQDVHAFRRTRTALQRYVDLLIRIMAVLTAVLVLLLGVSAIVHATSPVAGVRAAAVILALIPQGLQTMTIVSYAMGAVRMSGKGVLIQQANAIESMSDINILCLDKTGTLTTNALKLDATHAIGSHTENLEHVLGAFVASMPDHNRTSDAIRAVYRGQAHSLRESVSFSSEWKWSAALFDDDDLRGAYVLGAPEMLQPSLQPGRQLDDITRWTAQGLRVLLFASAPDATSLHGAGSRPQLPSGLIPMAFLTVRDELRPEARTTLQSFADAGIRLKFISGDSPDTVAALIRQTGFSTAETTVTGPELAELDEAAFGRVAEDTSIFGRVSPQQKEHLIRSLRHNGNYVAMIGDGLNDVLALKEAQVGIAMESGSQVTRGVADIVLMNNSFAALPAAFREGQRIMQGMLDVMRVLLSRTLYVSLLIIGAAVIGVAFPVTPTMNSIVALLTVGIPIVGLAAWARPGPPPSNPLLSVVHFVAPAATSIAGLLLTLYVLYVHQSGNLALAQTVITTAAVLCGLMLILCVEPLNAFLAGGDEVSGDWRPTALAVVLGAVFTALMAIPGFHRLLGLTSLRVSDSGVIVLAVAIWAVVLLWMWRTNLFERWLDLGES